MSVTLTPAQRIYLADLAAGRARGIANRRDSAVGRALISKGLVRFGVFTAGEPGVVLTDAGRDASATATEAFGPRVHREVRDDAEAAYLWMRQAREDLESNDPARVALAGERMAVAVAVIARLQARVAQVSA